VRTQVLRFLLVGVGTALADYGVYRLLLALDLPVTPAKTAGFVVGTTLSYLANRAWTFEAEHHAVGRFLAVYGVTLVANLLVNAGALAVLGGMAGSITAAWLLAQAVASALNFLGMRYAVFAEPSVSNRG
jgi:putative flippase GtrA